jgi:predicted flap endonuclease-1-like 5' DNA nuclease
MWLLNVFNNETFLVVAETLIIVIGSMLLGILLCYLNSWGLKSKFNELDHAMQEEQKRTADVVNKLSEVLKSKSKLEEEIEISKQRIADQEKIIYDQKIKAREQGIAYNLQKTAFDRLNATIDSYQHRINLIQEDLENSRASKAKPRIISQASPVSVSYEHVSKLIGRQVAENDLTLILGIGPKTAELLKSHGVDTWDKLAATPLLDLSKWLLEAGGIYKSQDPTSWSKQAVMAAHGEWRKLRLYQETLRS